MILHNATKGSTTPFSKNGSVTVDPSEGMIVSKKNLLMLLKRLEIHERKTKSVLTFHAKWFSDHRKCKLDGREYGEITTFRKNLLRYFMGKKIPGIESRMHKDSYSIPGKLKFGEIINKARQTGIYERFSWLEGMLLGITAVEKGLLEENNKSIYIFLSTNRSGDAAPCMLRFYRYGECWLRVDVEEVPFGLLPQPNALIIGAVNPILN